MPPKVSKPRKKRVIRKTKEQPIQIDLLRQGDFEVGFRPNLRPIQQASLLGNLLTNVSNQEKLSALSASLKQYEKQLDESKKSPNIVTTAEEIKPLTFASSQIGRVRDIKTPEFKERVLGQQAFNKLAKEFEQKQFKETFSQEFDIGTTIEQDLDALDRISTATRSALIQQRQQVRSALEPQMPNMPFGGKSRPTPLAVLQRRETPPLQSSSTLITREGVMAENKRENADYRSAKLDENLYD
jgi:hypothetical protein